MIRCAQLLNDNVDFDYLDINCGCPIDLIFNKVIFITWILYKNDVLYCSNSI